jgi:hypothetical protein
MKITALTTTSAFIALSAAALFLTAMPPSPQKDHGGSECAALAEKYDLLMSGDHGSCAADKDCACYGPVSEKSRCGGVTDRMTAEEMRKIEDAFHRLKCPRSIRCAPWVCRPACVKGRCSPRR